MNISLTIGDWDASIPECPFCHQKDRYTIVSDDYVTRPMLWNDCCGCRAFLDLTLDQYCEYFDQEMVRTMTVSLLKVLKVVDSRMINYYACKMLTRDECAEIINSYDPQVLEKYKLVESGIYNEDIRERDPSDNDFYFSFECNSYDAEDAPYPPGIHLNHDGVHIKVLLENGKVNYYWGD